MMRMSLDQLLSFKLHLNRYLKRHLWCLSLSPQEACILFVLKTEGPCTLEKLRGTMGLSRQQLNLVCLGMADERLVTRRAHWDTRQKPHKRIITLEITDLGAAVLGTADQLEFVPSKQIESALA